MNYIDRLVFTKVTEGIAIWLIISLFFLKLDLLFVLGGIGFLTLEGFILAQLLISHPQKLSD